jgi:CRP-like cAMP-binding protein
VRYDTSDLNLSVFGKFNEIKIEPDMGPKNISSDTSKLLESKTTSFLQKVSLLSALDQEALTRLASDFQLKTYYRDEIVFQQGDASTEFYIIQTGKVRIYKISPAGGETSTNIFFPQDILGEFAAIDGQPRSASAKALGRCTLLEMTRDKFLQHMRQTPDLALAMTQLLVSKLRWTATYAETVAQYDAAGRLLHILILYNEQSGVALEPGKKYLLDLALNQADLGSFIGARREWVNRLLREWRERGLLEYDAGKIVFLDLPKVMAERDSRIEPK